MFLDATKHASHVINNTAFNNEPFEHIITDNIFTEELYQSIQQNRIETDYLQTLNNGSTVKKTYSDKRYVLNLSKKITILPSTQRDFWESFYNWSNTELKNIILKKHNITNINTEIRVLYIRDFKGYSLGPHTDSPVKKVTSLVYLPTNSSFKDCGTSLFTPVTGQIETCDGGPHYGFNQFNHAKTIEYLPNRFFSFKKSNISFHGVEPLVYDIERDLIIYDISA